MHFGKLCRSAWRCRNNIQVFGVVRAKGRGVPPCVIPKEVSRKIDLEKMRGTLKAAKLVGDANIDGLVALLL